MIVNWENRANVMASVQAARQASNQALVVSSCFHSVMEFVWEPDASLCLSLS